MEIREEILNSLVFFYFGITFKSNTDQIIEKVLTRAYIDATNQGAFNSSSRAEEVKDKRLFRRKIMDMMKGCIEDYRHHRSEESFDKWHENTCRGIVDLSNPYGVFTYGNTQKLVNMTLKYFYLLNGFPFIAKHAFISEIHKDGEFLHVPIDRHIVDCIIKNRLVDVKGRDFTWLLKDQNKPIKELFECIRPSDYTIGWSEWNCYEKYMQVQIAIRIGINITPIDWEINKTAV